MKFGGFEKCTLIDYPGKTACMVYTVGCNFRCPYCHNPELVEETIDATIDEEDVLKFLDTRHGLLDGIVITGGEPTMHEELEHFIRKVKAKGFLVKLDSNGTNPAMLRRLFDEYLVDYIAMDIKSPLAKYSSIVARPVDVDKIQESVDLIMSSSLDYEFRTTLIKSLVSEDDVIAIGQEIAGAKHYYLQEFVPTKILNPQLRKKVTYTKEELNMLCEQVQPYVKHCAVR